MTANLPVHGEYPQLRLEVQALRARVAELEGVAEVRLRAIVELRTNDEPGQRQWADRVDHYLSQRLDEQRAVAELVAARLVVEAARLWRDDIDELAPDVDRSELSDTTVGLLDAVDALHPTHVWTQAEIDEAKAQAAEQLERLKPLIQEPS